MNAPLTTSPNSGIPAFSRKDRQACDGDTCAAGVLFVTPDSKALFVRRAGDDHRGEWALPAGTVEDDEDFEDAARRESGEEVGFAPDNLTGLHRRASGGVDFATFTHSVDKPFAPVLNDEHDGFVWADLRNPPEPLHPDLRWAIRKFFKEEAEEPEHRSGSAREIDRFLAGDETGEHVAVIKYNGEWPMAKFIRHLHRLGSIGASRSIVLYDENDKEIPIGWDGDGADKIVEAKVDGSDVLKERQGADELPASLKDVVKTDAALVLALDRESVRDFDKDNRLHVSRTNISKANVCPYRGEEIPGWQEMRLEPNRIYRLYRDPKELKKAVQSFNRLPLLRQHIPVSAEDHQPYEVIGTTGSEASFEEPYLTNSLAVWAKDAIDAIESKARSELSAGYHYKADMTPGEIDGMPYDGVMREIVGNHVALVETGRAGPDVVVADSMENLMSTRPTRFAALAMDLALKGTTPLLAADQSINLFPLFKDLTTANFKAKKTTVLDGLRASLKGRTIAKDAQLDHVEELLNKLERSPPKDGDESVSEEQHNAMAAAAEGRSNLDIPQEVGEEYMEADKGKTFDEGNFRELLKAKGVDEAGVEEIMAAMPSAPAATDEDPEKDDEDKPQGEDEDDDKDDKKDDKKDEAMGKDEMNAAIEAAVKAERRRGHEVRMALDEVRPHVGDLNDQFETEGDVLRHALTILGVDSAAQMRDNVAMRAILRLQPRAGVQAPARTVPMGADSATVKSFNEFYPNAARIGVS